MKNYFFPVVIGSLLFAGCSAAYKTGQTPDDVYFSSGPVVSAEGAKTSKAERRQDDYQSYFQDEDNAYLRMKVRNGGRWNGLDDVDYWYGYNGGCQCNSNWGYYNKFSSFNRPWGFNTLAYSSFYNPWSFNNWYNPGYYYPVIIVNKRPVYTNSSRPGLTGYSNGNYDRGFGQGGSGSRGNSRAISGSQFRTIFSGNNNSSRSSNSSSGGYDRPARTFTPSSSSTSSGGNSGGSRSSSGSSSSSGRGGRGGGH